MLFYCPENNELHISEPVMGKYLTVSEKFDPGLWPLPIKFYRYELIGIFD